MLINPKTICPALMFAASRNESVSGRTIILVVSIKIRNGFNHLGAPSGSKWAKDAFTVFLYEDKRKDSQIGRPNVSVKMRWLDRLKVYGIKPIKLIAIISMNRFEIVEFIPLSFLVNVRITCSFIIEIIIYIDEDTRFGVIQNDSCIIVTRAIFEISRIIVDLFSDVNL